MHSSGMCTVRNSSRLISGAAGGSLPPRAGTPPRRHPPEQAPPGAGILQSGHPLEQTPQEQVTPLCKACWDMTCNACWDSTPPAARHAGIPPAMHAGIAHPPVNRITDTCKNITFTTSLRTVIIKNIRVYDGISLLITILLISKQSIHMQLLILTCFENLVGFFMISNLSQFCVD